MMKDYKKTYLKFGRLNEWLGPIAMIEMLVLFFYAMIQNRPQNVFMMGYGFVFVSVVYVNAMFELRQLKRKIEEEKKNKQ